MTEKEEELTESEELQLQLLIHNILVSDCISKVIAHKGKGSVPDPYGIYASYFEHVPLPGMKVQWDRNARKTLFSMTPQLRKDILRAMDDCFWRLRRVGNDVERYATACVRVYGALTFQDFLGLFDELVGFDSLIPEDNYDYMITVRSFGPYSGYMVDRENTIIYNPFLFDMDKKDYMSDIRRFISEAAQRPRWKPCKRFDLYKYSGTYAGGKASQALEDLLVEEWGLDKELPFDSVYVNLYRSFANGGSVGDHLESIAEFLTPDPRPGGVKTLRLISAISAAEKDFRNPRLGGFRRGDKRTGAARKTE